MKKKLLMVAGLTLGATGMAFCFGIPGLPQIVWDPTTAADVMKDVVAATRIAQLVESTKMYFHSKAGLIGLATSTMPRMIPNNISGTTIGYPGAMSTGLGVQAAWATSALRLAPSIYMNKNNPRLLAMLANEEITEAAAKNAMQTHGQLVTQQIGMAPVIRNFTSLAADTGDGTNSMVEQLNLMTTGTSQSLNMQQAANAAQEAQLELQLANAKVQHDELAATIQYQSDVQAKFSAQGNSCVSCTLRPVIQ